MEKEIPLKLYNTLTRKKEIFTPIKDKVVKIYTCGPTVYWYAHIGNLRTYIFEDILKRVLEYQGYKIKHVMNITDVGHLVSDADTGEDKIEKAAKKERKSAWEIANFYEKAFKEDLKLLNIKKPDVLIRATETIKDQIELIKILEKKGFTYRTDDGIYFDASKLKTYGRLWPKKMKILPGARIEMIPGKKNPNDFALWKFTPPGVKREMEWVSPWGKGFPGWHTECVVMSIKELGIPFDIHCGGIDHILIHHTNEIAQAEAAYGKIMANFWLHSNFLNVKGEKMAKSKGNIFTLRDLIEQGFSPLAFRYLCLLSHYRKEMNFSLEALKASQNALFDLYDKVLIFKEETERGEGKNKNLELKKHYKEKFLFSINDDLNLPQAVAILREMVKDEKLNYKEKLELVLDFDKVFGLNLNKVKKSKIPLKIKKLLKEREDYRKEKNWEMADKIRKEIESLGYLIEDSPEGPKLKPKIYG